jgi:DNA-binding HxlR family transcriptional regulator
VPQVPPPKRHPYDQWSPDSRALDLVGDKWTLLIIRDLAAGPRRFVELQRVLPGISTEQLRSRLNRMVADGLLTRQRYREVPPRVDYELTERARDLMPVLGALARWGLEWSWSPPRGNEAIDVGAIFRLAPGLVSAPRAASGVAEFVVTGEGERPTRSYVVTLEGGNATISEKPDPDADVRVVGTQQAWVQMLGPEGTSSGLRFEGDEDVAQTVLAPFATIATRAAEAA